MKKTFTLLAMIGLATATFAQSQRTVLLEEATNASCGPCATQNPGFQTLLNANLDNAVSIKYQVWWPGYDPMYEHNEPDVDIRVPYYNIEGAPTAVIDGVTPGPGTNGFDVAWYAGAPGGYSQAVIDDAAAIPASFDITIDYELNPNEITIAASAVCTQDVSGDLKMQIVVVEKEINFSSAPGSNGETEFFNVMKKMLPNANGTTMATSYAVGEEFSTTQSWTLENVYDYEELAVIVFIQDDNDRYVHQAAFSDENELQASGLNEAAVLSASGSAGESCDTEVTPSVVISNYGSENLTSLTIDYTIDGDGFTVNWSGDLAFLETETVDLGTHDLDPMAENIIVVNISNPNGTEDEYADNDEVTAELEVARVSTLDLYVTVRTDTYAVETEWQVINSSGEVVYEQTYEAGTNDQWGGGGPDANIEHTHVVMLEDPFDCHTFVFMDTFGDGQQYGAGAPFGFQLHDGYGNLIYDGLDTGFQEEITTSFSTSDETVGVEDMNIAQNLQMYPNPSSEVVNIAFDLERGDHITVDFYTITGQLVKSKDLGTLSAGYSIHAFNTNDLNSGIYLVEISSSEGHAVRKLSVTK